MRLKEWFAWHFPEMTKIVNDNQIYARLVNLFEAKRDNVVVCRERRSWRGWS